MPVHHGQHEARDTHTVQSDPQRVIRTNGRSVQDVAAEINAGRDRPVVVVIGGAGNLDDETLTSITPIFEHALAPVLTNAGAIVVTGGTDSGVMALAGRALASPRTLLIGVSPSGARTAEAVELDSGHDVQVETEGSTWGSESDFMVELAGALTGLGMPRLVILVNGGKTAVEETNRLLDDGWPILCITGSKGAADDLVLRLHHRAGFVHDWHHIDANAVELFPLDGSPYGLTKALRWRMSADQLLKQAWISFTEFDHTANAQQRSSKKFRIIIGAGAFVFAALVTAKVQFELIRTRSHGLPTWLNSGSLFSEIAAPIAVALPLGLAVAAALSNSVAADRGWHTLRQSAEAIKREIYRYRAALSDASAGAREAARSRLKDVVDDAVQRCADAGVLLMAKSSLNSARPVGLDEGDEEIAPLTPSTYVMHRLNNQLTFFKKRGDAFRRRELQFVAMSALLAAAAGSVASTVLAPWSTFLVLAASGSAAYLERNRLRLRALQYARTAAALTRVSTWWTTVSPADQAKAKSLRALVTNTENVLKQENEGWSQFGTESLATIRDPVKTS